MENIGVYKSIGADSPPMSAFDLSSKKLLDCDIGMLVPMLYEECIPGDVWELSMYNLVRAQAMVAPIYHRMQIVYHVFFIPLRICHKNFEEYMTRGLDGDQIITMSKIYNAQITAESRVDVNRYGLWDYFGLPMHDPSTGAMENTSTFTSQLPVYDWPWRVFWTVWRAYYRDENIQTQWPGTSIDIGQGDDEMIDSLESFLDHYTGSSGSPPVVPTCDLIPYVCWEKDYFAAGLPWQQRGTAPLIPISGTTSADWPAVSTSGGNIAMERAAGAIAPYNAVTKTILEENTIAFTATGVDINELRLAITTQLFFEAHARGGYRYSEQLITDYGVRSKDQRLNIPEYIGGSKQPMIISEVIQTSETGTTEQGNMAGHGIGVGEEFIGRYRVPEHGFILGIMHIKPEAIYQQGIHRKFTRETALDWYRPIFANLSEQAVLKQELFFSRDGATTDETTFSYIPAFDEYRTAQSIVCGKMANDLDDWHFSRQFDSAPSLNEAFITMEQLSQNRRDAFAVSGVGAGTLGEFLVDWYNVNKVARPMPWIADPSRMGMV